MECPSRTISGSITSPHVLFVAPSAYILSGLATWLDYLLPGLESCGWRATLGLVAGPRHHDPIAYLAEHPWHDTVEIACGTGTEPGRRKAVRQVVQRLKPDIVCSVNAPDALAAVAELRADKLVSCRGVMSCHGIQRDLFGDMKWLESSLDAVICTNRLACSLAKQSLEDFPVRVQYASCGTEFAKDRLRAPLRRPMTIAYVGRFEEDQKRVSDVFRIIRKLAETSEEFKVIVAGGGPEEHSFRSSLESCLTREQLVWLGQLPTAELPKAVYAQSDVLLVTSHWETGPIVAWEAMAHGTIVVSSRYVGSGCEGSLRHEENCLLFDVGDHQSALDALVRVNNEPDLVDRLRSGGFQLIETRYSQSVSVDLWDRCFREIIEQPAIPLMKLPTMTTNGRLDCWLGSGMAEWIRERLGKLPPDSGPGGEWPHTLSGGDNSASQFWNLAHQLDVDETMPSANVEAVAVRAS